MKTTKHTLAMAHYDTCAAEAWGDMKEVLQTMRPLYATAPDMLQELELKLAWMLNNVPPETTGYEAELSTIKAAIKSAKGK
ncbi:MAG: hypothetical protein EBR82_67000 [Caulobacteraceae bacterium]|nr:hypothetical protein [Caulobacteraceae bacterium]